MFVGALLELGADLEGLQHAVNGLGFGEIGLTATETQRGAFAATHFVVNDAPGEPHHRSHATISEHIQRAELPPRAKERALRVFRHIAEAEAALHGVPVDEVHFHEVGAVDSIADIVGACVALEQLEVDELVAGPVPLGSGQVETAHGMMPLPAPATVRLLEGWPVRPAAGPGEWVTPTGAGLLKALARPGDMPAMTLVGVGHGAGTKQGRAVANIVRAMLGDIDTPDGLQQDVVAVLECQVDDLTGEAFPDLLEALFEAGAIDVFGTPIVMKKGRPGLQVTALVSPAKAKPVANALLTHSSTLGLRYRQTARWTLPREIVTVETPYGVLRVKKALPPDSPPRWTPEHDDCAHAAKRAGVSLAEVYRAALVAVSSANP